jgi:stage V sporulation protein D (sporulation-specific penicillin-binding protein)
MEPYVVSQVMDNEGNTVLEQTPTVLRQVIKEETSKTMCTLLRSVVKEGTAKNANTYGFSVGGKTGTSEKIDALDANGNPTLDKIVSFVGVAPMEKPEYIVLVALDTPSRQTGIYISGGVMAAPTVGAVMDDILPYLGVEKTFSEEEAAGRSILVEDMTGYSRQEAEKWLEDNGLTAQLMGDEETVTAQIPAAGQHIPGDSEMILYFGSEATPRQVEVPSFLGMNRQQASDAAGKLGLYILPSGNPSTDPKVTVTVQSISAGTQVRVGTTVQLEFTDTASAD